MGIRNTIHLRGDFTQLELPADAAIKPGQLLQRSATGVTTQSTSVGFAEKLFALEDALQGRTIDDAYCTAAQNQASTGDSSAVADPVQIASERTGNLVNAYLKAGTNYTVGTILYAAGDGSLCATTGTPKQAIAVVEVALDLSASGAVAARSVVRII